VLNFAALYGAGARAIAKQTGLEVWEEWIKLRDGRRIKVWRGPAYDALQAWWAGWPELKAWNQANMVQAQNGDGWVILDSGRMIEADPDKGYALTNYKVQGTSRDITCQAVLDYARLMPGTLATVIHDEILAEVPLDRVDEGLAALNQAMNFEFFSKVEATAIPMPITATAEVIGERWVKKS
jgi:DNA polymerase I-like protein with 3'-5' exonuclease and polymerase domains